jgi:EF-P beta-lysylation protein EpmB
MNESIPLWRKIQRQNFTRLEPLSDFLELSAENRKKLLDKPRFPLNLPVRLAEKIQKNSLDDPLLRQFLPLQEELQSTPGFVADPVQDNQFKKTKKLLHKYNGRALLISTSACAMHCRYCFRQNFPYETEEKGFDQELLLIRQDPSLQEIILSGGDPLSLSDGMLASLLRSLDEIPHLKRIRFHTRFPLGIPERIGIPFLDLLSSLSKQIIFVIHCNHPAELDADVIAALKQVQKRGILVLNQSVLLKGVNDDEKILLSLSESLINQGILPYYLHQLDPVQGAGHFALPESRGEELIRYIQKNLSGFGVPRLAREEPGQPSKTFLNT